MKLFETSTDKSTEAKKSLKCNIYLYGDLAVKTGHISLSLTRKYNCQQKRLFSSSVTSFTLN